MSGSTERSLLAELRERPLLADGAMGTQLMLAGLEPGSCGEAWNLARPEEVLAIQRRYVEAGSDCLLTNTFGASRPALERHGFGADAAEINRAAVAIARAAFGEKAGFVIGDIGPFGGLLEPYGEVPARTVLAALTEQAMALVGAGADALIIETQTSLEELGLGIRAARTAGARCIIGSMAFDVGRDGTTFRTMMGVDPERAADFMAAEGADVVALNCGTGMDMERAEAAVRRYRAVTGLPIMAQPNAGQPRLVGLRTSYEQPPAAMAAGVAPLLAAGARIVGGCCGSTPEHVRAFRLAINAYLQSGSGAAAARLAGRSGRKNGSL